MAATHFKGEKAVKKRYSVEALTFRCIDESGYDWLGSDEPMFVFSWTNGQQVITSRTHEFGDVDSGDTRQIDQFIVGSKKRGVAAPIGITVQLYEMDQGNQDEVKDAVAKVITGANIASILLAGTPLPTLPAGVIDKLTSFFGNDLLGSANVTFSADYLATHLPKVGQSLVHIVRFQGDGDFIDFEGGADYDLYLRVTRRPDQK
jgi:hypothetical protein